MPPPSSSPTTATLAFGLADRVAMIMDGEILFVGTPDEVKRNADPRIQEFINAELPTSQPPPHRLKPTNAMKDSIETRLGMFFALAIIAALVILESLGTFAFFKRGYHLHAFFKNVQELKVGDAVKMGGVPVGRVREHHPDQHAWPMSR